MLGKALMSDARLGQAVTVGAITVTLALLVFAQLVSFTIASACGAVTIALCCVYLYLGSRWARWLISTLLVLVGLTWLQMSVRVGQARALLFSFSPTLYFSFSATLLASGASLMFTSGVGTFLTQQRSAGAVVRRLLRYVLPVVAGAAVVAGAIDCMRLSGR